MILFLPHRKCISGGWILPGGKLPDASRPPPLVGLAAEKVIRDRYNTVRSVARIGARSYLARVLGRNMRARCA
ncbi:MAG: hypothetical protein R6U98_05690, partial [Pirellulaceae bacterium]